MNDFRAKLRDSGYRLTPQRELILAAVDTLGHATPDEVLAEVREHSRAVNASTVYRTLEVLEELGLVRHAHLSDRAPTYHTVTDHEHFHIVCRNCQRVVSVDPHMLDQLAADLREQHGFVIDVGHLTVFGPARSAHDDDAMSPLLDLPGAVAGDGVDAGVAAHYGSLYGEQSVLERGEGFVDLSHRDVIRVSGPDRLTWLHSLTTQHLLDLPPRVWTGVLVLSPQGHVEHACYGYDDGEAFLAHTEPGQAAALVAFLDRMRFMMRVEVAEVTDELAVTWRPRAGADGPYAAYELVPREQLTTYAEAAGAGLRAVGLRGAPHRPRRAAARAWTPTTAPSPTRRAGSVRPCTSTRGATAARRRSRACTRSAVRRAG